MVDTGAGSSVFPAGFSPETAPDPTRRPVTLTTATDESIRLQGGKKSTFTLDSGDKVQISHHESNHVTVPVMSVSESSDHGNWTVIGPGFARIIGPEHSDRIRASFDQLDGVDLVRDRGVYWLNLHENHEPWTRPLCPTRAAREITAAELDPREIEIPLGAGWGWSSGGKARAPAGSGRGACACARRSRRATPHADAVE